MRTAYFELYHVHSCLKHSAAQVALWSALGPVLLLLLDRNHVKEVQHGTLWLLRRCCKPHVLGIDVGDVTLYCFPEAARNNQRACFGCSGEELVLVGEQLFYKPRVLESGHTVPEVSFLRFVEGEQAETV